VNNLTLPSPAELDLEFSTTADHTISAFSIIEIKPDLEPEETSGE
jgi:hypothetical protein